MDISALAGAAITAIVTGALTKAAEPLGKGVSDKVTKLFALIKTRFKAASLDGLLTQLQEEPTASNIEIVKTVLTTQLSKDEAFVERVLDLLEQIQLQPGSQQVINAIEAENNIKLGDIKQVSRQGNPIHQSIENVLSSSKGDVTLGDISQEQ